MYENALLHPEIAAAVAPRRTSAQSTGSKHDQATFETDEDSVVGHLDPSDLEKALDSLSGRFRARSLPPETILAMEMERNELERQQRDGGSDVDEVDRDSSYHDPADEDEVEDFQELEILQNDELLRPRKSVNGLRKGGTPERNVFPEGPAQGKQTAGQYSHHYRRDSISVADTSSPVDRQTEKDKTLPDSLGSSFLVHPAAKRIESKTLKPARWSLWEMLMEDAEDVDPTDGFRIDGKW
jgi:hypothetical protein